MSNRETEDVNRRCVAVTLRHACKAFAAGEIAMIVPLGHHLSRARVRRLAQSERITVTQRRCPAGLAAFKKLD